MWIQGGANGTAPEGSDSPAAFGANETYDDDLAWIVEKLTERAGGGCGLLARFVGGDLLPVVMARYQGSLELDDARCAYVVQELRAETCRQSSNDDPLHQRRLQLAGLHVEPLRMLYMIFAPAPGVHIVAAVLRPETSFNLLQDMVARRLYPVLSRYVHLWWLHRTERRRAEAYRRAMDLSETGILLLDRRGNVVFANDCVTHLLDSHCGLRRAGLAVSPEFPEDAGRFQAAVQYAVLDNLNARPRAEGERSARMLSLRQRNGKRSLMLTVASLDRPALDPDDAAAIVYVLNPEQDISDLLAPVYRHYRLTPAETRLVAHLVAGNSMSDAAGTMHISLQTARAYLKQVFSKTSTNRQAELIRVMLSSVTRARTRPDLTLL